jgi:hypothetical protein
MKYATRSQTTGYRRLVITSALPGYQDPQISSCLLVPMEVCVHLIFVVLNIPPSSLKLLPPRVLHFPQHPQPPHARPPTSPLLRISFNPADSNYMSTFHMDGADVQILDMHSPGQPVMELKRSSARHKCPWMGVRRTTFVGYSS